MITAKDALEKSEEVRKIKQIEKESIFQECLSIVNQSIEKGIETGEMYCVVHKHFFPELPEQNFYAFLENLGYTITMYPDAFSISWAGDKIIPE